VTPNSVREIRVILPRKIFGMQVIFSFPFKKIFIKKKTLIGGVKRSKWSLIQLVMYMYVCYIHTVHIRSTYTS